MILKTSNFGTIEVEEDKCITFKEGLPGFEHLKQFILIEEEESPFHYLQSTEDGDIRFIITDPYYFKADYAPIIRESYFTKLGEGDNEAFSLYAIVTLKDEVKNSTLNLAGPLLIHIENREAVQVITEDGNYTTRHKIVELIGERS